MLLLVAEYLPTADAEGNPIEQRHIVSVFKLVQELVGPSKTKGKSQFQELMEKLPPNHKAKWFAGSALNSAEQAMASVLSTVLSRLNAFLDSEMEQILCFETAIDAEKFCLEAAITRQTRTIRTADADEGDAKAGGITDTGEQTMGVGADRRRASRGSHVRGS